MRFCPHCENMFAFQLSLENPNGVDLKCQTCGFQTPLDPKNKEDALILETNFRSGSSAGGSASGISVNEYTLNDPTLPHVKTIPCSNGGCPSQANEAIRDVIYIKTDPANLKFQYVCTVCKSQWTN